MTSVNPKELYTTIYKKDGHNYGELEAGDAMPKRAERHSRMVQKHLRNFPLSDEAAVLEIGAALGQLRHVHPNWQGIEYSSTAVALGLETYGSDIPLSEGDATNLAQDDHSIDFIFSFATLEHIPNISGALSEIGRVLAPNGTAFLAPAWNCRPWTVKKLQQRPYNELSLCEKIGKFLIPVRNHLLFRMSMALPQRLWRELKWAVSGAPQPLSFRALQPDFSLWETYPHISDDDAFVDLDAHAAVIFYLSRGFTCPSHPTFLKRVLCRAAPVVIQKPIQM